MGVSILVSLYTTRIILASLGASDFGVFNIVGGSIALLGFLNSTMANATQRFMSYAEGMGNLENKRRVFNVSILLHFVIALLTVILLLGAMPVLFGGIFNIEPSRVFAAKAVYFCLVFSTVLTIINVPYDAVMNAHENMLYYSIIGIFESLLKLGIAFVVVYTSHDKLIIYGVMMTCVPLITLSIMKIYCHRHYEEVVINLRNYWNWRLAKEIASFSGWNFMTAISSLFSAQGIGIILNHFFGTILNAAQGIAQQVNGALSNFSANMMKALNPVVVKNAGAKNIDAMNKATLVGCKYSSLLTLFFAVPVVLEIHYILKIWLTEVPIWAETFVMMQLTQSVIVQAANSASTAVYAQGDIKYYAIWKSIMNALPALLTGLAFYFGGSPIWLYIPMIVVWGVCGDFVIIHYAKQKCGLDKRKYILSVIMPILGSAFFMFLFGIIPTIVMPEGFIRLIITCVATTLGMGLAAVLFAVNKEEKKLLISFIKRKK